MGRFETLTPPKTRFSKDILEGTRFSQDTLDVQQPINFEQLEIDAVENEVLQFEQPFDPSEPPDFTKPGIASPLAEILFARPALAAAEAAIPGARKALLSLGARTPEERQDVLDWASKIENLPWYKKLPEFVGFVEEKVVEFKTLGFMFKALGLSKVLGFVGNKAAKAVIGKELASLGGKSVLLNPGGWQVFRRNVLQSLARTAPENMAFISAWSASEALRRGEPVGPAAARGATTGFLFSLGIPLLVEGTKFGLSTKVVQNAMVRVQAKHPKLADFLAGKPEQEFIDATLESFKAEATATGETVPVGITFSNLRPEAQSIVKAMARQYKKTWQKIQQRDMAAQRYWATGAKVAEKPPVEPVKPTELAPARRPAVEKVGVKPEIGIKVPPKPTQAVTEAPVKIGKELPQIDKTKLPPDTIIKTEKFPARKASPKGAPFGLPAKPATQRLSIASEKMTIEQQRHLASLGFVKMHREQRWVSPEIQVLPVEPKVVKAAEIEVKPKVEAEIVEPVEPIKIVSPEEAGPFKITFKGELPTKVIVDPKVRRSIQATENKIAGLKTRLKQARTDKKVAIINAVTAEIEKRQKQIQSLREKHSVVLSKVVETARAKIKSFQLAEKLSDQNRIDALDVVRQFVPKEKQERFTKRILATKTSKRVDRITEAVQLFIDRTEKRGAVREFKTFLSKTNREFRRGEVKLGKLPTDIRERVLEIVDKLDPVKLTEAKRKVLERRDVFIKRVSGTVASAFESLEEEAIDILQMPNARTQELDRLSKPHIGTLSTEQVNYVKASLEHLIQIARKRAETKEVTRSEKVAKQVNTARQEVSQRGKQEGIIKQPAGVAGLFGQVFKQGQSSIRTMTGRATTKDNKATMELLVENIQEAKRDEKAIIKEFSEASGKAISQDLKFTDKDSAEFDKLISVKLGGKRFKIDIDNLFSIYMHIKAEGNLRQLLKSEGLNITVIERNPKTLNVIKSKKQILTERVQLSELREVIKTIEAIPKFQELSETTFKINKDVVSPKVNETSIAFQNFPIARKDKYWPQPRSLVKSVEGRATDVSVAIEQQGMFLPKRGGTARLLIRPYRSQFVNILQTSAQFAATTLPMRDAKALLGSKKWQDNMRKSGRAAELKGITTMFRRMQGLSTDKAFVDQAGAKLLNNFGKSVLSLRLSGYGVQTASVPAAYEFIDPKYFKTTEAIQKIARVPNKDIKEMEDLSPTLWVRWKARQFNYVTGGVAAQHSFDNMILGKNPLTDKFLNQYTWGDQKAIKIIFDAAQNKIATEQNLKKGTTENKKVAMKETERALETQPNWDIVYRSLLTSSPNVFLRGSLMFLAARNAQMNVLMRAIDDFNKGRISAGEAGKRMRGVLYANILVAIVKRLLKLGIKASIFGLIFTLGDKEKKEAAVGAIAREGLKEALRLPKDFVLNLIGLAAFGTIPATIANETIRSFKRPTSTFRKIADIRTGNFFADLALDVTAIGISTGALGKHLLTQEKISRGPRRGRPKWKDDAVNVSLGIAELISIRYGLPLTAPKQELVFQTKAALKAVKAKKQAGEFD